jgi:hypothetical protein
VLWIGLAVVVTVVGILTGSLEYFIWGAGFIALGGVVELVSLRYAGRRRSGPAGATSA